VITFAGPLAARVCRGLTPDETDRLNGILYQGIICQSLLLRQPLSPNYLTYIADTTMPFTAVVDMSALVDQAQLYGHGLVYLPRYAAADDPYFSLDDNAIDAAMWEGLTRLYPTLSRDEVCCAQISRVRQVFAVPTLNYSSRLPPVNTTVPGLHLVNSAQIVNGTLNVNETVALAKRVLPQLLTAAQDRHRFPLKWHRVSA
jgi:protoporphyrinogen oxidase